MKFEKVKGLNDEQFRRFSGTKRTTFDKMVSILSEANRVKKIKGGRKSKLSVEDMLLRSRFFNERRKESTFMAPRT
ncbi:MAG: hypothetical protein NTY13_05765 [Chlamydiae bacterium]|nr:hypothetical protein [Chlamydiota bacterium]